MRGIKGIRGIRGIGGIRGIRREMTSDGAGRRAAKGFLAYWRTSRGTR
jgi:hypothetical protein